MPGVVFGIVIGHLTVHQVIRLSSSGTRRLRARRWCRDEAHDIARNVHDGRRRAEARVLLLSRDAAA
ncbi:hypothetical protein K438DRAFT_1807494 [Mycena galopus ATCC 62051]|nr:hypothetical protein K438DRAFT_1807494 [Mycena galopus ATCC 62051]